MFRIFKYIVFAIPLIAIAGVGYLLTQPCTPHTRAEIRSITDRLNEEAAVRVPHHSLMSDEMRETHADLIARVDAGKELNPEETTAYRKLGLLNLHQNQTLLSYLDMNFQVRKDVGMDMDNNVGSHGIQGTHDHHDASARANFDEILSRLDTLEDQGFLGASGQPSRFTKTRRSRDPHGPRATVGLGALCAARAALVRPGAGAHFETMLKNYKENPVRPGQLRGLRNATSSRSRRL